MRATAVRELLTLKRELLEQAAKELLQSEVIESERFYKMIGEAAVSRGDENSASGSSA